MADQVVVARITKNRRETIVVSLATYQGTQYLDVRLNALLDGQDEPRPTRKGVTLAIGKLRELRSALEEAEAEAERRGLLNSGGGQ